MNKIDLWLDETELNALIDVIQSEYPDSQNLDITFRLSKIMVNRIREEKQKEHDSEIRQRLAMTEHKAEGMGISGSITCMSCKTRIHNGFEGDINGYTKNYQEFIKKHYDHEVVMETDFAPELDNAWKDAILSGTVKVI